MYYTYLLRLSNNQQKYYIGSTPNLKRRITQHADGKCLFTSKFLPIKLIYAEIYLSENLAKEREYKLKQFGSAYRGLLKRLHLR